MNTIFNWNYAARRLKDDVGMPAIARKWASDCLNYLQDNPGQISTVDGWLLSELEFSYYYGVTFLFEELGRGR